MSVRTPWPAIFLALLAAAVVGAATLPVLAQPPAAQAEVDESVWVQRLEAGRQRVEVARARVEQSDAAYGKGRQRNQRGERRSEAVSAREEAARELEAAEAAWPKLLEEARRAGVSPGALRPFESP